MTTETLMKRAQAAWPEAHIYIHAGQVRVNLGDGPRAIIVGEDQALRLLSKSQTRKQSRKLA